MKCTTHYIERSIGSNRLFVDRLICLWEGSDLPSFAKREPYLFDDMEVAKRVMHRLEARFPVTLQTVHFPAQPITYSIETIEWDDESCPCCGANELCSTNPQTLSQFV